MSRVSEEQGGVLVLFGLMLPVLLLVLALVLDVGNWFVHKRHLQMQADAAALAGGGHFGDCFSSDPSVSGNADTTIESAATQYAGNGSSLYNLQIGGGAPSGTLRDTARTACGWTYRPQAVARRRQIPAGPHRATALPADRIQTPPAHRCAARFASLGGASARHGRKRR